mgnify:CR=1 FL=1
MAKPAPHPPPCALSWQHRHLPPAARHSPPTTCQRCARAHAAALTRPEQTRPEPTQQAQPATARQRAAVAGPSECEPQAARLPADLPSLHEWVAAINVGQKRTHLGCFGTKEEAAGSSLRELLARSEAARLEAEKETTRADEMALRLSLLESSASAERAAERAQMRDLRRELDKCHSLLRARRRGVGPLRQASQRRGARGQRNRAVAPISPEAWLLYWLKRLTPGGSRWLSSWASSRQLREMEPAPNRAPR